ncbi:MAG: GTP-binding protein [Thalassolituus sp.]
MTRVHLISGFLGVGKTTAILDLLQQSPASEKWAVLVNEFGEVGVDGAILESQGAVVREVPGGCLCCVSGLPFQMGLNMLLAKEKPDVLLIEPTGLGHPRKVLETLRSDAYTDLLEAGANLCLVDPRHLSDTRYTGNDTYQDQIALADVLVANKTDLCSAKDLDAFAQLAESSLPAKAATVTTRYGHIDAALLALPTDSTRLQLKDHGHHHHHSKQDAPPVSLDEGELWRRIEGHGAGHWSLGWLIRGDQVFSLEGLRNWFAGLNVERAKGLITTDQGAYVLNWRDGVLSEMPTRALEESRMELIAGTPPAADELEQALFACLTQTTVQ